MKAGFAEIDITPPNGTRKLGWIKVIVGRQVFDPLFARAAVLTSAAGTIGFIQLDVLSIPWEEVVSLRKRIEARFGVPGQNVMICATHNHGGPAIATLGDVQAEEEYIAAMLDKVVSVFGQAFEKQCEAEVGAARACEFNAGFNRRVIMRDGIVKTHGNFNDPNALCLEGPIDPEVFVLAARTIDGKPLGALVNFACHPAHHGPDDGFSAGWPGVLANILKTQGWPVPLFLNGAAGNISTSDPSRGCVDKPKEEVGRLVADAALRALQKVEYTRTVTLSSRAKTVSLPFRRYTPEEVKGTLRGAQRFVDPSAYDREMPKVIQKIQEQKQQTAEVLALSLNEYDFIAIPAEPFVELGLRIKEQASPRRAVVVGYANGMVGYVPHADAFKRGGYETTFCNWSKLAPEAGDIFVDAGLELSRSAKA
jgi:neutral ceramidase